MTPVAVENFGPLCDATLLSFGWEKDGRDVEIQFRLGGGRVHCYRFTWVDHLAIQIEQTANAPSQLFSWECAAKRLENGRLGIELDFAHQGFIALECEEILLDVAELP